MLLAGISNPNFTNPSASCPQSDAHTPFAWSCISSFRNLGKSLKSAEEMLHRACHEGFWDLRREEKKEKRLSSGWKEEQEQLLILNWVDHILKNNHYKSDCDLIPSWHASQVKFTSLVFMSVCALCGQPAGEWPGLMSPQPVLSDRSYEAQMSS